MTDEVMFGRFEEYNDHEGERWSWWLQLDSNENELDKLAGLLIEASEDDSEFPYELTGDNEDEASVDLLVRFADTGYYPSHNKVVGKLTVPGNITDHDWEELYKGGVADLFTEAA